MAKITYINLNIQNNLPGGTLIPAGKIKKKLTRIQYNSVNVSFQAIV